MTDEMRCSYCQGTDHVETACRKKSGDRILEVGIGCIFAFILAPFFAIGGVLGAILGAAKSGFKALLPCWDQIWQNIRGKKRPYGE